MVHCHCTFFMSEDILLVINIYLVPCQVACQGGKYTKYNTDQRPTYVQLNLYPQKWLVKDTARRLRRRSSINLTNTFIHSEEKIEFNTNKYLNPQ